MTSPSRNSIGDHREHRRALGKVALTPLSNIVSVIFTLGTLAVATRSSDSGVIAGYMAGSGIISVLAVAVGGGTTLGFATGDGQVRAAVKFIRYRLIVPVMAVGATLGALALSSTSILTFTPVLFGGFTVVLHNLAELESARHQRGLRTHFLLLASLISRASGFASVVLGLDFSVAMAMTAFLNLAILALGNMRHPDPLPLIRWRGAFRKAYRWELVAMTGLEVIATRTPFIVLPYISGISHTEADAFAALLSGTRSLQAVLTTGLYTVMAHQADRTGPPPMWHTVFGRIVIVFAFASIPLGVLSLDFILGILDLTTGHSWFIFMILSTPFVCLNRQRQYRLISATRHRLAALIIGVVAALAVIGSVIAIASQSVTLLALAPLLAEGFSWLMITAIRTPLQLRRSR